MDKQPLVSICIPTFNSEHYIDMVLRSALVQTHKNLEIMVVDNCSTDNTIQKVKKMQEQYPQIILHQNSENIGMVGNWNKCLEKSTGDFVNILHADDLYSEIMIEKQLDQYSKYPDTGLVFTLVYFINERNRIIGKTKIPEELTGRPIIDNKELILALMKNSNSFLTCPSVMIRKSILKETGNFNSEFRHAVDLEMWLRISKKYKVAIINENLMYYRITPNQATTKYHNARFEISEFFQVMDMYFNTMQLKYQNDPFWDTAYNSYLEKKMQDYILCYENAVIMADHNKRIELINEILKWIKSLNNIELENQFSRMIKFHPTMIKRIKIRIKRFAARMLQWFHSVQSQSYPKVKIKGLNDESSSDFRG